MALMTAMILKPTSESIINYVDFLQSQCTDFRYCCTDTRGSYLCIFKTELANVQNKVIVVYVHKQSGALYKTVDAKSAKQAIGSISIAQ